MNTRKTRMAALMLVAGLSGGPNTAGAAVGVETLTAIDLGVGQAYAINNAGQVVGKSGNTVFLTGANGVGKTNLGISSNAEIGGINDSGQVIGTYWTSGGMQHGFITGANGVGLTDLGTLGGMDSKAYDINNAGQVTGYSSTSSNVTHAFITGPNGVGMTDLGAIATHSLGGGINESGQVAGWGDGYAFITGPNGSGMTYLGNLGGSAGTIGGNSWGQAINSSGQVVGLSETGTFTFGYPDYHAFITGSNGVGMMDLGTLGGPRSVAEDINDLGQIIGWSQLAGDSPLVGGKPFVTGANGSAMTNLDSLVTLTAGAYISRVERINNFGQIIAAGSDGHAYLLTTAVPEPETYAMMLAGLGLLGFAVQRRKPTKV